MNIVKKVAIGILFLLGIMEILYPTEIALLFYAYYPEFHRTFDVSKLTEQQQQLCQQFHVAMNQSTHKVAWAGIATIVIAILLLIPDKKKPGKRAAAEV